MRILSNVAVSGNFNLGATNKKDTYTIGTPDLENDNVNTDVFTVWANANFKNNVQLGSNSSDLILVSGSMTTNNISTNVITASVISASNTYSGEFIFTANTIQGGIIDATEELIVNSKFFVSSGSNKPSGTATLNGSNPASVTVTNSLVTTGSIIILTKQTNNHNSQGNLAITKSAGSFIIYSDHNGDTDSIGYLIINN